MIHVCFGLYDKDGRYSKFTGTTIASIFENTKSKVAVHILHDDTLTDDNRDKFVKLAKIYKQKIFFYNVEQICPDKIERIRKMMSSAAMFNRFTIGTVYRILAADLLPNDIDNIIYLDSDIIVNLDIKEVIDFFSQKGGGTPLGAVSEFDHGMKNETAYRIHNIVTSGILKYTEYFCAGVLIINLNYWRENPNVLNEGLNYVANNTNCDYFDQDILNYCFGKTYLHMTAKYHCNIPLERRVTQDTKPAIYHYLVQSLGLDRRDNFNKLWFKYFEKTPWFSVEAILNIGEGARKIHNDLKDTALRLSILMSKKRRAFFIPPVNIESIKQIFNIDEGEEIISADAQDAFAKMVISLKESQGRKFFYLFVPDFRAINEVLIKNGLVKDIDYIDGTSLLSERFGMAASLFDLIKAL